MGIPPRAAVSPGTDGVGPHRRSRGTSEPPTKEDEAQDPSDPNPLGVGGERKDGTVTTRTGTGTGRYRTVTTRRGTGTGRHRTITTRSGTGTGRYRGAPGPREVRGVSVWFEEGLVRSGCRSLVWGPWFVGGV